MRKEGSAQLLAIQADTLYETWQEARADGVVDAREQAELGYQIGHLRLSSEGHVTSIRLGLRIINGGTVDRDLGADVRSYQRWSAEQKKNLARLAPIEVEVDERQAA